MPVIWSQPARLTGAFLGSMMACQVNSMSLDVMGCPSDQKAQGLSFQVTVKPSAETSPLPELGISVATYGIRLFLSSHLPGPTPNICQIQAAKLMLLNIPTAWSGSCSKAMVMPFEPLSALVGSQPVWGVLQAAAAGVPVLWAPGWAPGEGGTCVGAAAAVGAEAAGVQAATAMLP